MWIKEKIYKNKFHIVDKCDIITQKNYIERESYMKKIFSLFLSIAMLATLGIVPVTANADVATASATEAFSVQGCYGWNEYAYAKDMGVIINFDDITHLKYFEENVGEFPETVCCRFNTGGDFRHPAVLNRLA